MADKKSFVLYCDYRKHFSLLSPEEQGCLIMAIFEYVETGAEPVLEAMPLMAFSFIRAQLDRDIDKYQEICRKRKEAGSKGGRPPKAYAGGENQTKAKKPNGFSENQTKAKKPDNDTVNVNVNETVNETVIYNRGNSDESPQKKTASRFIPPTIEDVRAYCIERGNGVNPESFVDFYASKGWMVSKPLYDTLGVDVNKLKKNISQEISRGIASGLMYNEIARNIEFFTNAPLSRAKTIVRTEAHRIQEASTEDARQLAKSKGADVVKQWDATLDGDTRPTHRELDGQIRELDEYFEANGKKAKYPGEFGDPAEDCNCRCAALTRARWALDEDELETLKERAEFFDLDKADSFKDFKKKYLKAAQTVENTGKSGIIEAGNLAIPKAKLTGYALDPQKSSDKAKAFKLALGYDQSNADELLQNIIDNIDESKFVEKGDAGYGMLYQFVVRLTGANGKEANVLTAWIADGKKKRLTSVYVTEKKVTE